MAAHRQLIVRQVSGTRGLAEGEVDRFYRIPTWPALLFEENESDVRRPFADRRA